MSRKPIVVRRQYQNSFSSTDKNLVVELKRVFIAGITRSLNSIDLPTSEYICNTML